MTSRLSSCVLFNHLPHLPCRLEKGDGILFCWRDVPNRRMEDVIRVIGPLQREQALIVAWEGQQKALLLRLIQQIDITSRQRHWRKEVVRSVFRPAHVAGRWATNGSLQKIGKIRTTCWQ